MSAQPKDIRRARTGRWEYSCASCAGPFCTWIPRCPAWPPSVAAASAGRAHRRHVDSVLDVDRSNSVPDLVSIVGALAPALVARHAPTLLLQIAWIHDHAVNDIPR